MVSELITQAQAFASRGEDLYADLGINSLADSQEIHKSWRRLALRYHPDKAGASYNEDLLHRLTRVRDVLQNLEARKAYDSAMAAGMQKRKEREAMDSRRRKLVEELERGEREAKRRREEDARREDDVKEEVKRAAEKGRERIKERQRLMREAEERERMRLAEIPDVRDNNAGSCKASTTDSSLPFNTTDTYDAQIADLERRIREKNIRKAEKKEARKKTRASDVFISPECVASAPATPSRPDAPAAIMPKSAASTPGGVASSSTNLMARLRAAQAKKEQERRRREGVWDAQTVDGVST